MTTPQQPLLGKKQLWLVFAGLMSGMMIAALDQTIVSTALPTIVGDLGGLNHLSWVVTSYILASTVSTPLWGKLGDLYGRKRFFQAAIVIFLIGSVLSGAAQNLDELIGFRALQGLGAGGLIVGAQAIIGAVVSPRDRGRYMGLMGSVFAVASVIGPLAGGFFTDSLSWRWVFYINLPIGAVALAIVAVALPSRDVRVKHSIDYLGAATLGTAATALILGLTWGGNTYAWTSPVILGLFAATLLLLGAFLPIEKRAAEPIIPPHLFKMRVFRVASMASAMVGFSMFGAITFLPLFLQTSQLASPTVSGLQLLPIMALMLTMSIWCGRRISATGRYRRFPIAGTILLTIGLYLLSTIRVSTPYWHIALFMAAVGAGLGLTMQVMVLAVQNSVDYKELGTATSAATFFRSIGGSLGIAVFGAIFANRLTAALPAKLQAAGASVTHVTPAQLKALRNANPTEFHQLTGAVAQAIHVVFLSALPFAGLGILLALLLREVPLRRTTGRNAGLDAAESQAMPGAAETAPLVSDVEDVSAAGSPAAAR